MLCISNIDMKKYLFAIVALLTMTIGMMAQTTTVKGILTDKVSGETEPFATVRVFKSNKTDKPVAMFLTDVEGRFSHEVKGKGKFDIVFSSVGKEDLKQTIELGSGGTLDIRRPRSAEA